MDNPQATPVAILSGAQVMILLCAIIVGGSAAFVAGWDYAEKHKEAICQTNH